MPHFLRALSALALAGLLTHCATSSGAAGSAAGDGVSLRFAWPEGLTLKVAFVTTTTQNEQPPEQTALTYQLRLEGQGKERKLFTEQMTDGNGPPLPRPTMVLGPQGELLRVEGVDEIVQQMAQEAESQGIPKDQQTEILRMVRDAMDDSARGEWSVLIGKWVGLTLKPGVPVERKAQATVALFGSTADILERVTLKERVPCTEGAPEKRCVRLVVGSSLDPKGLDQATENLEKKLRSFMKANMALSDAAVPEMKVMKLRVDSTTEFIVEPETLIPHRERIVTNTNVVVQANESEMKNFDIQTERAETFTPAAR